MLIRSFTCIKINRTIMTSCSLVHHLKEIFLKSVNAVLPSNLIKDVLHVTQSHLVIKGESFAMKKPCYMIGFGKAVLGMAIETERILGGHLKRAIVTVPVGIFENHKRPEQSKIEFIEGARNNLPDNDAVRGATLIKDLVEGLDEQDLLIVLISGGGSALLPLPIPPITLEEKVDLITKLAKRGASITELNTIRKQISVLKGGGLARIAYPCRMATLILSDIIGDPLDLIASAPTMPNGDSEEAALDVLKTYGIQDDIPCSIKSVLENGKRLSHRGSVQIGSDGEFTHVRNFIIGNNEKAAAGAKLEAENKGFQSSIVSTSVEGSVGEISKIYASLARHVVDAITDPGNKDRLRVFVEMDMARELRVRREFVEELMAMDFERSICLVFAGEPTVLVKGKGVGGRNQQLALSFSYDVKNFTRLLPPPGVEIAFLSCGTDGIDGPTDAAGAVCDLEEDMDESKRFLDNNDSYSFYQAYKGGRNLIKIGHTGTNVMDIHLMLFQRGDLGKR